jgi:cobyric acid synthase
MIPRLVVAGTASLVGKTLVAAGLMGALLRRGLVAQPDAAMIRGFAINTFRGGPALFADGYAAIERLS